MWMRITFNLAVLLALSAGCSSAQTYLFDLYHGQRTEVGKYYQNEFTHALSIRSDSSELNPGLLNGKAGLIIFSPTRALSALEKESVISFLRNGGSMLLIIDEERRTPLHGINDIITPFGLELSETIPAPHNCGAIAEPGKVCAERREIPYSGGRSVKGGTVISRVYADGEYVHSAYVITPKGGRIVVMGDGMAGLLLGGPEGVRLQGTNPSDSKYWGKDSEVFMTEVLTFLSAKN